MLWQTQGLAEALWADTATWPSRTQGGAFGYRYFPLALWLNRGKGSPPLREKKSGSKPIVALPHCLLLPQIIGFYIPCRGLRTSSLALGPSVVESHGARTLGLQAFQGLVDRFGEFTRLAIRRSRPFQTAFRRGGVAPRRCVEVAKHFGASRWQDFLDVELPVGEPVA